MFQTLFHLLYLLNKLKFFPKDYGQKRLNLFHAELMNLLQKIKHSPSAFHLLFSKRFSFFFVNFLSLMKVFVYLKQGKVTELTDFENLKSKKCSQEHSRRISSHSNQFQIAENWKISEAKPFQSNSIC